MDHVVFELFHIKSHKFSMYRPPSHSNCTISGINSTNNKKEALVLSELGKE